MVCIQCSGKTQVTNSRYQRRSNRVWRRRRCLSCGALFTTEESAQLAAAWVVQAKHDSLAPFSRDKLFVSLFRSCEHRATALADAGALTDTVMRKLAPLVSNGTIQRQAIANTAQVALNRFDTAASVYYQAHHQRAA